MVLSTMKSGFWIAVSVLRADRGWRVVPNLSSQGLRTQGTYKADNHVEAGGCAKT